MKKITFIYAVLLMAVFSITGYGMMIYAPLESQVPSADIIVVAIVTEVQELEGQSYYEAGRATLKINEVLKNGLGKDVSESILMTFPVVPKMTGGYVIMDHGGMVFQVGEERIFLLKKSPVGFSLVAGSQSRLIVDEKDNVTNVIAAQNITVSVNDIDLFYFNLPQEVTLTVSNGSDYDIVINYLSVDGFYHSPRIGTYVSGSVELDDKYIEKNEGNGIVVMPAGGGGYVQKTVTVPKNSTLDITAHVTITPTPAFLFLGEDSGLFASATLRIGFGTQSVDNSGVLLAIKQALYITYYSNWQELFLGYKGNI